MFAHSECSSEVSCPVLSSVFSAHVLADFALSAVYCTMKTTLITYKVSIVVLIMPSHIIRAFLACVATPMHAS